MGVVAILGRRRTSALDAIWFIGCDETVSVMPGKACALPRKTCDIRKVREGVHGHDDSVR